MGRDQIITFWKYLKDLRKYNFISMVYTKSIAFCVSIQKNYKKVNIFRRWTFTDSDDEYLQIQTKSIYRFRRWTFTDSDDGHLQIQTMSIYKFRRWVFTDSDDGHLQIQSLSAIFWLIIILKLYQQSFD